MRKAFIIIPFLLALPVLAAEDPIDRWASAVGGRDKVAAIKSIYREASIEYAGLQGTFTHAFS